MFDYQKVELSGITFPTMEEFPHVTTASELITHCARVSNPKNQIKNLDDSRLIRYLITNSHWSPFEMASMTVKIDTTRDIARQILRHRSFSFQEFCVSGNTKIHLVNKSGKSKKVKIEDLYKRFTNTQYWEMSDNIVRIYDREKDSLSTAKIKEVFHTGVKPVYRLTLVDGKTIDATEDHKFMTLSGGFKRLADLDITQDFVATNGVPVYQDREWMSNAKEVAIETKTGLQGIADMAGVSYHTIRKWLKIHGLQFAKKEVSSYTEIWNKGLPKEDQPNYGKFHSEEVRNKIRESSTKGNESNLYKNGKFEYENLPWRKQVAAYCYGFKNELLIKQQFICPISGVDLRTVECEIDHIEPVFLRPDLAFDVSNLRVISKIEHDKKNREENIRSKIKCSYKPIKLIEYVGEMETYDLEIEHADHNYIANGIVTHNSQRYASVEELDSMFVYRDARRQDLTNRQNSIDDMDDTDRGWWAEIQNSIATDVEYYYKEALRRGIAKEQARVILPEGLTSSRLYMAGTIRSWIHYCDLRGSNGTQLEHIDIANKAKKILIDEFPSTKEYFDKGNLTDEELVEIENS